jgi:ribonuclease Y
MGDIVYIILAVLVGLGGGAALAGILIKNKNQKLEEETRERVKSMLREAEINAETIKKERMLEAKEKYLKLKSEFDEEMNNKKNIIITNENKVKQREQQMAKELEQLKRKEAELDSKKENLSAQLHSVQVKKEELDKITNQRISDLEKIASLTREEAKQQIITMLTEEAQSKASSQIKDILDEAKLTATKQAKKIVIKTHPDKSNLDKEYFLFFIKAFKIVNSIHQFRTRSSSTVYTTDQFKDEENEKLIKLNFYLKVNLFIKMHQFHFGVLWMIFKI